MAIITFVNQQYLWLFFIIPFLILTHFYGLRFTRKKALRFANFEALARVTGGHKLSLNLPLLFLRFFTLLFLILALAAPIIWYTGTGGDFNYVIAIDSSGSMLADDFSPNRLESAKQAALEFMREVHADSKVGLLSFSGTPFVKEPLTEEFEKVQQGIRDIRVEYSSGTAIGDAIISASTLLLGEEKARVVVLLTDGQSNVGTVLEKAINYANEKYVTVYTIGMATVEGGQFEGIEAVSTIDTNALKQIAENTGGSFYRASNNDELVLAYREIARTSEKKLPIKLAIWLVVLTFITLSLEWIVVNTKFRSVP